MDAYGTPLIDDPGRIGEVTALGLDETLFVPEGPWNQRRWVTSIVDVTRPARLLDVVEDRTANAPSGWLEARPQPWRDAVGWGAIDLSGPYRRTFSDSLPNATLVADPFHVITLANTRLGDVPRRTQQDTLGHRGHRPTEATNNLIKHIGFGFGFRRFRNYRLRVLLYAGQPT